MPNVFISYRRDDSPYVASLVYNHLALRFGRQTVFMDIDKTPPGVDFRQHIGEVVQQCDVVLAIIGDRWLGISHADGPEQGQRRLDDPDDLVRLEIEAALARGIPVVPILVNRTMMPRPEDLPESLRPLVFQNAVEVRAGRDLKTDVGRVLQAITTLENGKPEAVGVQGQVCTEDTTSSGPTVAAAEETIKQQLDNTDPGVAAVGASQSQGALSGGSEAAFSRGTTERIQFTCTHCDRVHRVAASLANRCVRCNCGYVTVVPRAPTQVNDAADPIDIPTLPLARDAAGATQRGTTLSAGNAQSGRRKLRMIRHVRTAALTGLAVLAALLIIPVLVGIESNPNCPQWIRVFGQICWWVIAAGVVVLVVWGMLTAFLLSPSQPIERKHLSHKRDGAGGVTDGVTVSWGRLLLVALLLSARFLIPTNRNSAQTRPSGNAARQALEALKPRPKSPGFLPTEPRTYELAYVFRQGTVLRKETTVAMQNGRLTRRVGDETIDVAADLTGDSVQDVAILATDGEVPTKVKVSFVTEKLRMTIRVVGEAPVVEDTVGTLVGETLLLERTKEGWKKQLVGKEATRAQQAEIDAFADVESDIVPHRSVSVGETWTLDTPAAISKVWAGLDDPRGKITVKFERVTELHGEPCAVLTTQMVVLGKMHVEGAPDNPSVRLDATGRVYRSIATRCDREAEFEGQLIIEGRMLIDGAMVDVQGRGPVKGREKVEQRAE